MLSAVLKTDFAIEMSVKIIRSFIQIRKLLNQNELLFKKIEQVEKRYLNYEIKTDDKIDKILKAIESKNIKPIQ
jgi:hypothetical protein